MSFPWDPNQVYSYGSEATLDGYNYVYVGPVGLTNQHPRTATFQDNVPNEGSLTRRCWLPCPEGTVNSVLNGTRWFEIPYYVQRVRGSGEEIDKNIQFPGQQGQYPGSNKGGFLYNNFEPSISAYKRKDIGIGQRDKGWYNLDVPSQRRGPYFPRSGYTGDFNYSEDDYAFTLSSDNTFSPTGPLNFNLGHTVGTGSGEMTVVMLAGPGTALFFREYNGIYDISAFINFITQFDKKFKYKIETEIRSKVDPLDPESEWGPWVPYQTRESFVTTGNDIENCTQNSKEEKFYWDESFQQVRLKKAPEFVELEGKMLDLAL